MAKFCFLMLSMMAVAAFAGVQFPGQYQEALAKQEAAELDDLRRALAAKSAPLSVSLSRSSAAGTMLATPEAEAAEAPAAAAAAPVAGPAAAQATDHASPADLTKLSEAMSTGQATEKSNAADMFGVEKLSESVAAAHTKISEAAASAELAHTTASDAHTSAQEMSTSAAEAKDAANKAVAAMDAAKTYYDNKLTNEYKATEDAAMKENHEKKAQVAFETAALKVQQLKEAQTHADKTSQDSKDTKIANEAEMFQLKRKQAEHLEALTRAQADGAEKHSLYDIASKTWQDLHDAHMKAEQEEEILDEALGKAQSESAKYAAEEKDAIKEADLTREDYSRKDQEAHRLDQEATLAEARAKAAATESQSLAKSAKADADAARAQ